MESSRTSRASQLEMIGEEKASPEYWEKLWSEGVAPTLFDPTDTRLNNHVNLSIDAYFSRILADCSGHESLLEIGCARSIWLPHFARRFGFSVTGLDRSPVGCAQARGILRAAGVEGDVVEGDMFSPPAELKCRFDLVVSFGVFEHFADTAGALEAGAAFLKPGGRMITLIPNLCGAPGWLQRRIDRGVYDIHVPLTEHDLAEAHRRAGLVPLDCRYLLSANWSMVAYSRLKRWRLEGPALRVASAASKLFWVMERGGLGLPPNRLTSPYVVCHAVRR
jgi:SAM-dependent methyltransferase